MLTQPEPNCPCTANPCQPCQPCRPCRRCQFCQPSNLSNPSSISLTILTSLPAKIRAPSSWTGLDRLDAPHLRLWTELKPSLHTNQNPKKFPVISYKDAPLKNGAAKKWAIMGTFIKALGDIIVSAILDINLDRPWPHGCLT